MTMGKSLYHIETAFLDLMRSVEDADGEINEDIESALAINRDELVTKASNYIEFIGDREAFLERVKKEKARLTAMQVSNTNLIDRLKNSLLAAVELYGEFSVGLHKVGSRKSTRLVVDANVDDLPDEYVTIKITKVANSEAIKRALKAGDKIDGCSLLDNKNLAIK